MKTVSIVGARPQFIKEAVVNEAARQSGAWEHVLVHSGQHYDVNMSDVFFSDLAIPKPDYFLNVGSGTHAQMTAGVLMAFEQVLLDERPDMVLVYGDTNTTLAGALAASKLKIPVAHVEAGLRQVPSDMPEEINRQLTDRMSDHLFCCSGLAVETLAREGKLSGVHSVGDVMYDLYLRMEHRFSPEKAMRDARVKENGYIVATLHRDFNVDSPGLLRELLQGLSDVRRETGLPVLFPVHPRTRQRISEFSLEAEASELTLLAPMGYVELMSLVQGCAVVVTDSGGLQKEAYFAGKRAAVVMPDTCWKELIACGWNVLTAPERQELRAKVLGLLQESLAAPQEIYGSGEAGREIVSILGNRFGKS